MHSHIHASDTQKEVRQGTEAEGELVSCLLLTSILAGSPWLTDGITPISTFFYTQHHTPGLSSYKDTDHSDQGPILPTHLTLLLPSSKCILGGDYGFSI